MWSSGGNHLTDAELHEKDTHLLISFGICYCAFFIWLFCCPIPVWGTPIIKKGAIVYRTPLTVALELDSVRS